MKDYRAEAIEMGADMDDAPLTMEELRARNCRWAERQRERVAKGRPAVRTVYQQHAYRDGEVAFVVESTVEEPMLSLLVARHWSRRSERGAMEYGELLQRIVSPLSVKLP